MKKIRICIVSLYAYHLFNPEAHSKFGGAEEQLYYLATGLAKDPSFEVNFLVGDFGQPDLEVRDGVRLYKFFNPHNKLKYIRAIFSFVRLWRLLRKIDADLYIQRAAGLETGEAALFSKFYRKKFVYMIAHDADVQGEKPSWFGPGIISSIRWMLFQVGLRNASLIIAQHEIQRHDLMKNYAKASVIRNSAHIMPAAADIAKKDSILWVARGDDWKQPEVFLRLPKQFPDEKFVMVMPQANDVEYFKKIKQEAQQIPNLEFHDFVAINEIDQYFARAKVFVITSKTEGFPNTFIHALKNKTPVLTLNFNPGGLLEKYDLGFGAKGNENLLAINLNQLLNSDGLRLKQADNAYTYAQAHHNIETIIEEDKKLLVSLLEPLPQEHPEHE